MQNLHLSHKDATRGAIGHKLGEKRQLLIRLTVAIIALAMLFSNTFRVKSVNTIGKGCFVDNTFVLTKPINHWLRDNPDIDRAGMIVSSVGIDLMFIFGLIIFNKGKLNSFRIIIAMGLFFALRGPMV